MTRTLVHLIRREEDGYTLVELVVVMVILGVVLYPQPNGEFSRYYLRLGITTNPARVPVFGLDADTSEGDSGGAVFSKDRGGNALVGVFVSGVPGADTLYTAQLLRHEHAIPASVIVKLLQDSYPATISQYTIKFQSPNDPVP